MTARDWTSAREPSLRAWLWQGAALGLVVLVVALFAREAAINLRARGIASGFAFLGRASGFEVAPGLVAFSSRDTVAWALGVGLINTLRAAFLGIVLATVLGVAVGIARLSTVPGVATVARWYVEVMRNTPLLLQLLFWYALSQSLPGPDGALHPLPGIFLCNRGLYFPALTRGGVAMVLGLAGIGVLIARILLTRAQRRRAGQANGPSTGWMVGGGAIACAAVLAGASFGVTLDRPVLDGFNFRGGLWITPEFAALVVGLVTNSAAFIGEIVRSGILSVARGQVEAATALGLPQGAILRRIVLPQALPVMIPPMTSQYLAVLKNSSLAIAIGYTDLIAIGNVTLNQSGQAIETLLLVMASYLVFGLLIAAAMSVHDGPLRSRRRELEA